MRFGQPWVLLALPAVVVGLAWALGWAARRRTRLLDQFTGDPGRTWSATSVDERRRRWQRWLTLATVGLLLAALSRPLWFVESDAHELQGVNYLIALDASRSMLAADVRPSRYAATTNVLDAWLANARTERIGLITFAGAAYLNAPLTFDTSALRLVLSYIEPDDLLEGGTSLAVPLERAAAYFQTNNLPQRLVVLISDGEELEGNAVDTARRLHEDQKLVVCTIGVGTAAGGRIPATRPSRERADRQNRFGQEVVTRLNDGLLRRVANAGGGRYYPLGAKGEGLDSLRREVIARMGEVAAKSNLRNYRELYQIPLTLALLGLLAQLGLGADGARSRRAASGTALPRPGGMNASESVT